MKYFIFFLFLISLIGCGKEMRIDNKYYRDEDGDQIVDRDELSKKDQLIANLISMETIQGEIIFYEGISGIRKHTLKFTNEINLERYALNLLIKNRKGLEKGSHFSEFTHLRINSKIPQNTFDQKDYQLHLKFNSIKTKPKRIYFVAYNEKTAHFSWQQEMTLNISKKDFHLLLSGQAFLAVDYLEEKSTSFSQDRFETIKNKTYRTIIHDGEKTQVLYVSKALQFDEILKSLDIQDARHIEDINLFNMEENSHASQWWFRIISEDDIVLVKESEANLKLHFIDLFEQKKQILQRENGLSKGEIKWSKPQDSRMILKLKGFKTELSFQDKRNVYYKGGKKDGDECIEIFNLINQKRYIQLTTQDILDHIFFKTDGSESHHQIILKELSHEWEIQVPEGIQEISINIKDLEKSMFRTTGLIQATCGGVKTSQTAIEGEFSLDITSYIEKI
jgi:hypothetical protein